MKKLFFICLLICIGALIASKLSAQTTTKKSKQVSAEYDDPGSALTPLHLTKFAFSSNFECDTLVIEEPTKIKVIKIGDKYYNIVKHETTIEEDKSLHLQLWQTIPPNQWYGTPNGSNLIPNSSGVLISPQ